jgi:hypothetical protein
MNNSRCARAMAVLALAASAWNASAHGDEPHGDEPHPLVSASVGTPRIEAATETFEMVGRLENGALTLFINRFETSEPVLDAEVELESGDLGAKAGFRAEQGSYVLSEPKLLQALQRAGAHPLVVTVTAGHEADLLEATLDVAARDDAQPTGNLPLRTTLAGVLGLGAAVASGFMLRRRRAKGEGQ